jgi:hypothetical protein
MTRTQHKTTLQLITLASAFLLSPVTHAQTLPEKTVTASKENAVSDLVEEQRIGSYNQPEWTSQRRFARSRVYVLPEWQVEVEQWYKGTYDRHATPDHLFQTEISLGLPYRFQVDLYENLEMKSSRSLRHKGVQVEMRWAFADWGVIPLNPTIYGEYKFNDHDADAAEVKLLLAEELAPRWHWAANFAYEKEIEGSRDLELAANTGISYTIIDEKLSAGIEMEVARVAGPNFHGKPSVEFLVGPSVQWRPIKNSHLDIVPLIGITKDSPAMQLYVIFGFDFGGGKSHYAPASIRSK